VQDRWDEMKPAIDQMIAYLEGEMFKCTVRATFTYMDRDYRVLEQARRQAEKIKERCDADAKHEFIKSEFERTQPKRSASGGIQVVEIPNEHHGDVGTTDCLIPSICTITTDRR